MIAGAGHSPNVEKPAETAGLVLEFAAGGHGLQEGVHNRGGVRPHP
jgi:hypothetical protein